jgi:hypothetical protein
MDILAIDHVDYYMNIQLQLKFRENTVKTAYKIREVKGKNDE